MLAKVVPFFMQKSQQKSIFKLFIIIIYNNMEITINNKKYELKYTIRALFIFEKLANRSFSASSLTDLYLLFYSLILANNNDCTMTFEDLINECDNDSNIFEQYNKWLIETFNNQNQFNNETEDEDKEDSKKK